jgi:hypothetical protein
MFRLPVDFTEGTRFISAPARLLPLIWCSLYLAQSAMTGQTLQFSSADAVPEGVAELEIRLKSPPGSEPLGVQLDLRLPASQLTLESEGIELGAAAKDAGKTLHCAATRSEAKTQISKCIVLGGQKVIPNGTIARVRLRILPNAVPGTARVQAYKSMAVSKAVKAVPIPDAEGLVTIRGK